MSTARKIILATEENVVAALHLKSGQILWRQVLEKAHQGKIQYLNVDRDVVTVSGTSPWLVRTWDSATGRILTEWSFALSTPVRDRKVWWHLSKDTLTQVVVTEKLHFEISRYDVRSGYNNGTTEKVLAPWIKDISKYVNLIYVRCLSFTFLNSIIIFLKHFEVMLYTLTKCCIFETYEYFSDVLPNNTSDVLIIYLLVSF